TFQRLRASAASCPAAVKAYLRILETHRKILFAFFRRKVFHRHQTPCFADGSKMRASELRRGVKGPGRERPESGTESA
ncbi:hypothetical protein, partial [Phaeovulum veldkampii]